MKKPLVVANLKMEGSLKTVEQLLAAVKPALFYLDVEVVVCPALAYLSKAYNNLKTSELALGAQNVSQFETGAYTGEVSAKMLKEVGCRYVIIGHSERRHYFAETDAVIRQKYVQVRKAGLKPILCVGETREERDAGQTEAVIQRQLSEIVAGASSEDWVNTVIAYEPVWAIGTGVSAQVKDIETVHALIRKLLKAKKDDVRIIYGGSVKADNAETILAGQHIDGALVGSASLKSLEFMHICESANQFYSDKSRKEN